MKKIFLALTFTTLLIIHSYAFALTREIKLSNLSNSLPSITVTIKNGRATWSAFLSDSDVIESVMLLDLGKSDAKKLLLISKKAQKLYATIENKGNCQNETIKSGEIGKLTSNEDKMKFEVICKNNYRMVQITMLDEYAVNIVHTFVDWQDIEKMALSILEYYQ